MKEGSKFIVKQVRGTTGRDKRTKATLQALGLGKVGSKREHIVNPCVMGMVQRVQHLLEISEVK
jgi:large subunit ribosomal protein L30